MIKKLEKMNLGEVIQLRDTVAQIAERYANQLTTYGMMNNDIYLQNITNADEINAITKHRALVGYKNKLDAKIESIIFENYVE